MKKGKLSDLCIVIAGQSPQGSAYNDKGDGIEFHQGKKAFGESYLTPSNVWTTEITKIAEPLDILMSVRAPVGPTNITDRRICIGRGLAAIRCKEGVLQKFILYALRNIESKIVGNDGAVFNSINKAQIEALPVPIIPLPEQERIVSLLDAEFAKIDAIKANAEKQLKDAKALFQSALKDYLTPKEGWEEKTLKEIGKTQTGCTPSMSKKEFYNEEYMPFIKPSEINYDGLGGINYNTQMLSKLGAENGRIFQPHSIFMVCIGATISKLGISEREISCNQQINVLTPKDLYHSKFIYYAMLNPTFINLVKKEGTSAQATLPIISKGKWEQLKIKVPQYTDQLQIAEQLDKLSAKIKSLQSNFDTTVTLCNDLKQSILKDIFG